MSVIASFYTLSAERATELISFAVPRDVPAVRKLFGPLTWKTSEQRTWHDYLTTHAREEAFFCFSGRIITDLDQYLDDLGLPTLRRRGNPSLTSAAADAAATPAPYNPAIRFVPYRVVFDHASAVRAAEGLASVAPPSAEHLSGWEAPPDPVAGDIDLADWARRIDAARHHVIGWLKSVGPRQIGVLDVG